MSTIDLRTLARPLLSDDMAALLLEAQRLGVPMHHYPGKRARLVVPWHKFSEVYQAGLVHLVHGAKATLTIDYVPDTKLLVPNWLAAPSGTPHNPILLD